MRRRICDQRRRVLKELRLPLPLSHFLLLIRLSHLLNLSVLLLLRQLPLTPPLSMLETLFEDVAQGQHQQRAPTRRA